MQALSNGKIVYVGFDNNFNSNGYKTKMDNQFNFVPGSLNSVQVISYDKLIELVLGNNNLGKISGIYPGAFSCYEKEISKLSEANIFFLVNQAVQCLNNINYNEEKSLKYQDNRIEWEYAFDFCLANLSRFGVEQRYNLNTMRMETTDSFNAWYQWWYEYFEGIMDDPDLSYMLYHKRKTCQDLSMFRPSGNFESYLSKNKSNIKQIKNEKVS